MKNAPPKKKKPAGKTKKAPAKKTKKIDTSPAAIRRRIRARNARFKRLTPEQKRVAIAKDVIEQLDLKILTPQSGVYFANPKFRRFMYRFEDAKHLLDFKGSHTPTEVRRAKSVVNMAGGKQVCDELEGAKCTVCGIGAAFVSAVRLGDELTAADLGSVTSSNMRAYLVRYFDPPQVALIECAFEHTPHFATVLAHDEVIQASHIEASAAASFGRKYERHDDRMRAIFQNIIDNNGTFVPSDKPRVPGKKRRRRSIS